MNFFLALGLLTTLTYLPNELKSLWTILTEDGLYEPPNVRKLLHQYDFIIVGAGTAGCVLANRLSENPDWTVLLIEAGGPENYLQDIPLATNYLQLMPDFNWKYLTEPSDQYCLAMNGQQCAFPRGKGMGGSSALNHMMYTRGHRNDYDNWAKMGCEGWSYEEVLPYFKKMEHYNIKEYYNPEYHGKNGPVNVELLRYESEINKVLLQAGREMGYHEFDYTNLNTFQKGLSKMQTNTRDGIRFSSNRAYLHPIRNRKNLHVSKYSHVVKVLIDPTSDVAYGVDFMKDRQVRTAHAKKEVILSAGTINSAQLLMLSGIGPRSHLHSVGIEVIRNLPVGRNLQDHIVLAGMSFLMDKYKKIRSEHLINVKNFLQFLNGYGPVTIPGPELIGFTEVQATNGNFTGYPDIEYTFQNADLTSDEFILKDFNLNETLFEKLYGPLRAKEAFMLFIILQRPESRGVVLLKDKHYYTKPKIIPNYFSHPLDVDTLAKAAQKFMKFIKAPALKAINVKYYDIPLRKCQKLQPNMPKYWECLMRHFSFTLYHLVGTCRMGAVNDPRSVVDPKLKVIGIRNLRVIDASVIPKLMVGHTNGPTYMLAEKGADLVKESWR